MTEIQHLLCALNSMEYRVRALETLHNIPQGRDIPVDVFSEDNSANNRIIHTKLEMFVSEYSKGASHPWTVRGYNPEGTSVMVDHSNKNTYVVLFNVANALYRVTAHGTHNPMSFNTARDVINYLDRL